MAAAGQNPVETLRRMAFVRDENGQASAGREAFNQPVNPDVDPDELVRVVDLEGVIPMVKDFTQEEANSFVALWKGAKLALSDGGYSARLSSFDPDHAYWSSDNRGGRVNETRRAALTVLDRVPAGARRIEDMPSTHAHDGVGKTIRFYVPVRRYNDNPATLRIVAHVLEGNEAEIDGVEIYDVIRERPTRRGEMASETDRGSVARFQSASAKFKRRLARSRLRFFLSTTGRSGRDARGLGTGKLSK